MCRKRSQVAVIDRSGEVLANRNVPNGLEPILGMIGGLPPGTPTAFEAVLGWWSCWRAAASTGSTSSLAATVTTGRPGAGAGPAGAWLDSLPLPSVSREVINDDLALIDALQIPIDRLDWEVHQRARSGPRVKILAQLRGLGPVIALVILAEIGDASRFGSARKRAAWAGLTPTARGFGPHHPARPHLSITATLQA
jgi:hypothetical protein